MIPIHLYLLLYSHFASALQDAVRPRVLRDTETNTKPESIKFSSDEMARVMYGVTETGDHISNKALVERSFGWTPLIRTDRLDLASFETGREFYKKTAGEVKLFYDEQPEQPAMKDTEFAKKLVDTHKQLKESIQAELRESIKPRSIEEQRRAAGMAVLMRSNKQIVKLEKFASEGGDLLETAGQVIADKSIEMATKAVSDVTNQDTKTFQMMRKAADNAKNAKRVVDTTQLALKITTIVVTAVMAVVAAVLASSVVLAPFAAIASLISMVWGLIAAFCCKPEGPTHHEKEMEQFNKVFEKFDQLNNKIEEIEGRMLKSIGNLEGILRQTEQELKDHLMYALALHSIRESIIEILGIGTMLNLKQALKADETIKEDLVELCTDKNPYYLMIQLVEKLERAVGVEGFSVFEAYIRLRGIGYDNADAFVGYVVHSLIRGMTIASECYGLLMIDPDDAVARMQVLGSKVTDAIRFLYQIIYDGFEKFDYRLGKPIMSDGLATLYRITGSEGFVPGFEMDSDFFKQPTENDNDFAVKITTGFRPQSTHHKRVFKKEDRCGTLKDYNNKLTAEIEDKGPMFAVKNGGWDPGNNEIRNADIQIALKGGIKNGGNNPVSVEQVIKSNLWPHERAMLTNKSQNYKRGFLRSGDLRYGGNAVKLLKGTERENVGAYKGIHFKGNMELEYTIAYNLWINAHCGGEYQSKWGNSEEKWMAPDDNMTCNSSPADTAGFKLHMSELVHNSTNYIPEVGTKLYSKVAKQNWEKYFKDVAGIERYDFIGRGSVRFPQGDVCINRESFDVSFKIPVYKILNPRDKTDNPQRSRYIREFNIFDERAEKSLRATYGRIYEEVKTIEEGRRKQVLALQIGFPLGFATMVITMFVCMVVAVKRRRRLVIARGGNQSWA